MEKKYIAVPAWWPTGAGHNWRTTLSWGVTGIAYILSHQTDILPHVPPKYQPLAGAAFGLGVIVSGLLTKDAGNHHPPSGGSVIIDPTAAQGGAS